MAIKMIKGSPFFTWSPILTFNFSIIPGIGETAPLVASSDELRLKNFGV